MPGPLFCFTANNKSVGGQRREMDWRDKIRTVACRYMRRFVENGIMSDSDKKDGAKIRTKNNDCYVDRAEHAELVCFFEEAILALDGGGKRPSRRMRSMPSQSRAQK